MIADNQFFEVFATVIAAVSGVTAILVLGEKTTGILGRWFQRQYREASQQADALVRYHLGPNGSTMPMHVRIQNLESDVTYLKQLADEKDD